MCVCIIVVCGENGFLDLSGRVVSPDNVWSQGENQNQPQGAAVAVKCRMLSRSS